MQYLEACKILGIQTKTSPDDAKIVYRRLAQKHHPDKGGDMEHFKKVAWAYKTFIAKRPFIRVIEMKQRQQNPQQADRKDWSQWEEPVTVNEEQIVAWRQQLAKNSKKESMQYK